MLAENMQTGLLSELSVMNEYAKRGYSIYTPFTLERCDFIAEKNGRYVRVQVKSGTNFNGGREVVGFSQKPYTKEDTDIVVVFDQRENRHYYIPVEHVEGMKAIRLRLSPYLYHVKKKKALHADNYTKFLG
ncbi:group I intron-associated PD-(D/E)XK endonuclease [Fredinandcohnia humi]